jgi:hypothetical protein
MKVPFGPNLSKLIKLLRGVVLLEAGAGLIFFGSLTHQESLAGYGEKALQELDSRGYTVPSSSDPVRVYPAETAGPFTSHHAGGWRPGVISLRADPQGAAGPEVYLRHELMHEASFRTCGGKVPLWAEEAAAIAFSGEIDLDSATDERGPEELHHLRRKVRIGATLDKKSREALSRLIRRYGWPAEPCAISEAIQRTLTTPENAEDKGFSYVLSSLISGRILDAKGDLEGRYPPGSLLKIPYAAALRDSSNEAVGQELVTSDTAKLLKRKDSFDFQKYRFLISQVKQTQLGRSMTSEELARTDDRLWRPYLGERDGTGDFPLEASLKEIALVLRLSLLSRPPLYTALGQNGFVEGSTLFLEPEEDKAVLRKIQAMAKTGTVADERGTPLIGHLMVAWPAEAPAFLAVFRCAGINGSSVMRRASPVLDDWSKRFPVAFGKVRVRLLALVPPFSWKVVDECPTLERETTGGWKQRISACGQFRVISSARGSRSERFVSGLIVTSPDGQKVLLETDAESYADGVLAAEARDLKGEAQRAIRAVAVWNGVKGRIRHQDTEALCDTTHCMVFMGSPEKTEGKSAPTDSTLLKFLEGLAARDQGDWFAFSKGGNEHWKKEVTVAQLREWVKEPEIMDIRRERKRNGEIVVHLLYPTSTETVPCEVFRNRLKLLSCPEVIRHDSSKSVWIFEGIGEGHGQGLSVEKARALAQGGHTALSILMDAYQ